MERHLISRNIRSGRYLMMVIAMICAFVMYIDPDSETTIASGAILVASCVIFYLLHRAREVSYDENYLYLTGRNEEEVVPLENIVKIKLTMTQINDDNLWKITYNDAHGVAKAVRILPRLKPFEQFKEQVSTKNPQVQIKNYSHSFDFDQ